MREVSTLVCMCVYSYSHICMCCASRVCVCLSVCHGQSLCIPISVSGRHDTWRAWTCRDEGPNSLQPQDKAPLPWNGHHLSFSQPYQGPLLWHWALDLALLCCQTNRLQGTCARSLCETSQDRNRRPLSDSRQRALTEDTMAQAQP